MLELDIRSFVRAKGETAAGRLIRDSIDLASREGHAAAALRFVREVGIDAAPRDEGYYRDVLYYQLGLLAAHACNPSLADEYIAKSQVLPGAGGDMLFSDHQHAALKLATEQDRAREAGLPPILLASMPRSASATLTQTLSDFFSLPVLRLSAGDFPHYYLIRTWVARFLAGGAGLTHDHFTIDEHNAAVLGESGIEDIFVLARDPRSAAHSLVNFGHVQPEKYDRHIWIGFEQYLDWMTKWLRFTETEKSAKVHWITSRQAVTDPQGIITNIIDIYSAHYPEINKFRSRPASLITANFVEGRDDAWRERTSGEIRNRMWAAIPLEIRTILDLAA